MGCGRADYEGQGRKSLIGIQAQSKFISRYMQRLFKINNHSVVEVTTIGEKSLAQQEGVKVGDLIFAIDGKPAENVEDLYRSIALTLKQGSRILAVVRSGVQQRIVLEMK